MSFFILREIHSLSGCGWWNKRRGEKQLLAFRLASLVTELQNLDNPGDRRKNICPWDITAGIELLFFLLHKYSGSQERKGV